MIWLSPCTVSTDFCPNTNGAPRTPIKISWSKNKSDAPLNSSTWRLKKTHALVGKIDVWWVFFVCVCQKAASFQRASAKFLNYLRVLQERTMLTQDLHVHSVICIILRSRHLGVCAFVFACLQVKANICKCHKAACAWGVFFVVFFLPPASVSCSTCCVPSVRVRQ